MRYKQPLRHVCLKFFAGVFLFAGISAAAIAQSGDVTLSGVVTDQSGAVVPSATVTATNVETRIARSANTDTSGRYTILSLVPGAYDVQAAQQGFATVVRRNQEFLVGTTVTLEFTLQVSSTTQTVEVSEEVPLLQATDSTVERVLQTQELDTLPSITRSFSDLAALAPGVSAASNGSVTIGPNTAYQTGFVVDDVSTEDNHNGGQLINFAQDWIQEFAVQTQSFPAEFGGASGGVVNAITRSGGNDIHGRGYGFFQNGAINAAPYLATTRPASNTDRGGGMIGGPIKKDKLFYFGGLDWFKNGSNTIITGIPVLFASIPGAANGVYPTTSKTWLGMLKFDYQANPVNAFNLRVNYEHDFSNTAGGGSNSYGTGGSSNNNSYYYSGLWKRIVSSSALNEVRLNYVHTATTGPLCNYEQLVGPYKGGGANATPFGNPTGLYANINYAKVPVSVGCGTGNFDGVLGRIIYHAYDAFSKTAGKHDIKFGVDIEKREDLHFAVRNNDDNQYVINSTVPFNPNNPATFPVSDILNWTPDAVNNFSINSWGMGAFIQDTWKATENLTVNAGVRYDLDLSNSELSSQGFIKPGLNPVNDDLLLLAPRVGIAWTPFHDNQRTVIRGGGGLFYDQNHSVVGIIYVQDTSLPVIVDNVSAVTASLNPYCVSNPACANSVPAQYQQAVEEVLAYALQNVTTPNFFPTGGKLTLGTTTYTIPPPTFNGGPNGTTIPAPTGAIYNIDQNFPTPGTVQATIGVEHQFTHELNLTADFLYTRGFDQVMFSNTNINPTTLGLINPNYTSILTYSTNGSGVLKGYSLLVHSSYRTHRGDSLQVAYTLGWQWNNAISSFALSAHNTPASDPFDFNVDYGPSTNDARHRLVVSGLGRLPLGIQFAPIFQFTSALPYTATTTAAVSGCPAYYSHCYPTGYTRDSLRGNSTTLLNARLSKEFRIRESKSITPMFEVFNLLNMTNLGTNFTTSVLSAKFRQPTGSAGPRRQLQFGIQFNF